MGHQNCPMNIKSRQSCNLIFLGLKHLVSETHLEPLLTSCSSLTLSSLNTYLLFNLALYWLQKSRNIVFGALFLILSYFIDIDYNAESHMSSGVLYQTNPCMALSDTVHALIVDVETMVQTDK